MAPPSSNEPTDTSDSEDGSQSSDQRDSDTSQNENPTNPSNPSTPSSSAKSLVRFEGDPKVYAVTPDSKLKWIPSPEVFTAMGYKWNEIEVKSQSDSSEYQKSKLIRAAGDKKVYYQTDNGKKKWIPTAQAFQSYGNKWEDVVEVSPI